MNILFVNRHTRADEELGRHEMLVALPVGRLTNSITIVFLSFMLNLLVAGFIAFLTLASGIDGVNLCGVLVYGFSIGMQGFVFAMITLLSAQLFSTAKDSMGVAFAMLGISYLLRAYGDMNSHWLSLVSPMGLGLRVEAFYTNNFIPIFILFAEAMVFAGISLWVNSRRDSGAGIFPARKGKAQAGRFLQTPLGFAWRLSRNGFYAWAIGIFVFGASYASVIGELDNFVEGNEMIKLMLQGDGGTAQLIDAFIALLNGLMALLVAIPLINCINRLRNEEKRGRLELIAATAISKKQVMRSFIIIAVFETIMLTFLGTFGLYAAAGSAGLVTFEVLLKAAFVYWPALFVMLSLAVFLVGLFPKFTSLIWILFGYSFIIFYFGKLFNVPHFAAKLSPFGHIPQLPVQEFSATPILIMSALARFFCALGVYYFGRRDLNK
jgi:ABC-2 type transport system permease protein